MPDVTEIYVCRPGQALRQGALEYSSHIADRDNAASDAARRCALDPGIARIAYYAVDDSGNFRNFFTYENPAAGKPASVRRASADAPGRTGRRRPAPSRAPSLFARIRSMFEVD